METIWLNWYLRICNASGNLPKFVVHDLYKIHGAENYRKTEGNTFPYMLCSFVSDSKKNF